MYVPGRYIRNKTNTTRLYGWSKLEKKAGPLKKMFLVNIYINRTGTYCKILQMFYIELAFKIWAPFLFATFKLVGHMPSK